MSLVPEGLINNPNFRFGPGFKPETLDHPVLNTTNTGVLSIAQLLLEKPATAVFHLGNEWVRYLGEMDPYLEPVLLGVNYHEGNSEGAWKIAVQDVIKRVGPWVLFAPPGSNEKKFYLQNASLPYVFPPQFENQPVNPLKIRSRYYHVGDPNQVFTDFRALGYEFVDNEMTRERYAQLEELAWENPPRFT